MHTDFPKLARAAQASARWRFHLRRGPAGFVVLAAIGIAIAGALWGHAMLRGDFRNGITGTISDAKALVKQDGTREHPYADESQCPRDTDVVFWNNSAKKTGVIAYFPPEISVCFVEVRSTNNGPELTHDR